jgi:hypothetical protein
MPVLFERDILRPIILRPRGVGPGCSCHQPMEPNNGCFVMTGLDLSSHEALLRGGMRSRANIVLPVRPCDSVLYQKLTASPPFGARMPRNGPPFLTEGEIQLIHDWIAEGARAN